MEVSEFNQDQHWMLAALAEAKTAQYRTRPNPAVGCVIVKNQQMIGRGATAPVGGSHAEVFALAEAGEQAQGATAYVTLEPCAHYGRTPPCAKGLVEAGIARVVVACLDPNPLVAGKGIQILQQAGIQVDVGVCEQQAIAQNQGFLKAIATGKPYVRLKIAASLDGRTAMASGESKWITGPQARQDVQHWRALSGVVITGIETVLADDCQLNVRELSDTHLDQVVQPLRLVLDRRGRLPRTAKILQQPETVLVMGPARPELVALGVRFIAIQPLTELLAYLTAHYKIYDVLVEAGATVSTAFLQDNVVDELIHYVAPALLGATARPMFNATFSRMAQQRRFKLIDLVQLGDDVRFRLLPA